MPMIVSTKAAVLFPPLQAASSTGFPRPLSSLVNDKVSLVYPQSRPLGLVSPLHTYSCLLCHACLRKGTNRSPAGKILSQLDIPLSFAPSQGLSRPGSVNFNLLASALSAALSYSVPSSAYSRLGLHPHSSGPLESAGSFILPALHRYIVPFSCTIISFFPSSFLS